MLGLSFQLERQIFFINISDGKVKLELEDSGSTISTAPGNRMKVLKDNEGDTLLKSRKNPLLLSFYFQFKAQKLSEFISVEEYEVVISKLVDLQTIQQSPELQITIL